MEENAEEEADRQGNLDMERAVRSYETPRLSVRCLSVPIIIISQSNVFILRLGSAVIPMGQVGSGIRDSK